LNYLFANRSRHRTKEAETSEGVIKSIGYLDELEHEYDDPFADFTKMAIKMTSKNRSWRTLFCDDKMTLARNSNYFENLARLSSNNRENPDSCFGV
jgi:hypothetical protein